MRVFAVVMMAVTFSGLASAAEVYKWTDADGHVHYGDHPTPAAQKLTVTPGSGGGEDASKVKQAEAAATEEGAKKAALCKQKQGELATYQKSTRLVERDNLGHEREYSEDDRKKLIDLTQKSIKDNCP